MPLSPTTCCACFYRDSPASERAASGRRCRQWAASLPFKCEAVRGVIVAVVGLWFQDVVYVYDTTHQKYCQVTNK